MAVNLESVSPPRRLWRLSEGGDLATTATIILLPFLLTRKKKLHEGLEDPAGGGTLRPFSNRELLVFLFELAPFKEKSKRGANDGAIDDIFRSVPHWGREKGRTGKRMGQPMTPGMDTACLD